MALWGKTDTVADVPKYLSDADKENVYFVDITEAGVAANKAKGLGTGGWNVYTTYTAGNGDTRNKAETIVAMGVTAVDAGDAGAIEFAATTIVSGSDYTIITAGDSDFTLVGAANNDVGTSFTANADGTPTLDGTTGTVSLDDDGVVADS